MCSPDSGSLQPSLGGAKRRLPAEAERAIRDDTEPCRLGCVGAGGGAPSVLVAIGLIPSAAPSGTSLEDLHPALLLQQACGEPFRPLEGDALSMAAEQSTLAGHACQCC